MPNPGNGRLYVFTQRKDHREKRKKNIIIPSWHTVIDDEEPTYKHTISLGIISTMKDKLKRGKNNNNK